MKSTIFVLITALSLAASFQPAQSASCNSMAAKRASYSQQAEEAALKGNWRTTRKLLDQSAAKASEMRRKGCR